MKKFVPVLLILIALIALALGFTFLNMTPSKTYTVTLTQDGFKPNQITIKKGDNVTFNTKTNTPFWPASDIHPTHGIYPEFDPKEAIAKNSSWTFKFNKVGSWSYHDHLAPYYTGKVIVK